MSGNRELFDLSTYVIGIMDDSGLTLISKSDAEGQAYLPPQEIWLPISAVSRLAPAVRRADERKTDF